MTTTRFAGVLIALAVLLSGCAAGGTTGSVVPQTRVVTDMEGRTVEVPSEIARVVTLGSVPPINSFLFALGKGDVIVNDRHERWGDRWDYQYLFAPGLKGQPQTQNADNAPLVETIVELDPDVILTMSPELVEPLEAIGVGVIVLQWREPTDVTRVVDLLGDLLGVEDRARAYSEYFDSTIVDVADLVDEVPESERRSALYLSHEAMTRPHLIGEWWIAQAGGLSVTAGTTLEVQPIDVEQIINGNPDVIFAPSPEEAQAIYDDERLAAITAVANREVYPLPIAAHNWGNRTSEQPLTVYWAASKLYPDLISDEALTAVVEDFYREIFRTELTRDQIAEILSGR
jgi:iron complex transport system substrate-binding protein